VGKHRSCTVMKNGEWSLVLVVTIYILTGSVMEFRTVPQELRRLCQTSQEEDSYCNNANYSYYVDC
jgi:hypothetical protein